MVEKETRVEREVHTEGSGGGDPQNSGWVIALVVLIVGFVILWFFFLRGSGSEEAGPNGVDIQIDAPDNGIEDPTGNDGTQEE